MESDVSLDIQLPELVREVTLGNGIRSLLYEKSDNPTVSVYGSILAGASSEPHGKSGIAELTTRLLIRGSTKYPNEKIADLLESVGASISFRNGQDSIVFQARMTSQWLDRVLEILGECLSHPSFALDDIEKEKEILLADIRLRDDNTTRRGMRELHRLIYPPNHPYSRDRFGSMDAVKNFEKNEIMEYYTSIVQKSPVIVAFAGQFEENPVLGWTKKVFGERSMKTIQSQRADISSPESSMKEIVMSHKIQSDILIGCQVMSRVEPEYEPLNLLNVILGELGFMGRLGERIRDKEGLAYSASSFVNSGLAGGNWTALAGVNPKNLERALELMREEIQNAWTKPVTREELRDAKQNQIGSVLMELESTDGIARTAHNLTHFNLGLDYFMKRRKTYEQIHENELLNVAQKYLDSTRLSTVIVGPRNQIKIR